MNSLHIKAFIGIVFALLFLSCETHHSNRPSLGEPVITDDSDDKNRVDGDEQSDGDVVSFCATGEKRRSSVRCGDEFGGYLEEICLNSEWNPTGRCLHPTISVTMVEDLTKATPSTTFFSSSKIDGNIYMRTTKNIIKTDGTSAGTQVIVDKQCAGGFLGTGNITKIGGSLYYLCLDDALFSYKLLRKDEITGKIADVQNEIGELSTINLEGDGTLYLYHAAEKLLLYSSKDKALFAIDTDNKTVVLLKKEIAYIKSSFLLKDIFYATVKTESGEYLFFMTDGTVNGTKNTIPAIQSTVVDRVSVTIENNNAYLIVSYGYDENSLWFFDGENKTQKTVVEKSNQVGIGVVSSCFFDGKLYYSAWYRTGLFVTDGTVAGTKELFAQSILQNTLFSIQTKLFFATKELLYSYDDENDTFEELSAPWKEILYADAVDNKMIVVALKDDGRIVLYRQENGGKLTEQQTLLSAKNNFKEFDHIEYRVSRQDKSDSLFLFKLTKRYMGRGLPGEIIVNAEEHYLFLSDGTAKGTIKINEDRNEDWSIFEMLSSSIFEDTVIYSHFEEETGAELWSYNLSNHTSELLKDISNEGTASSHIENIFAVGNSIYFSQQRKVNGAGADRGDIYWFEDGKYLQKTTFVDASIETLTFIEEFVSGESRGYFSYDKNIYAVDGTASSDLTIDWPATEYFPSAELSVFDDRLYLSARVSDQGKTLYFLYAENEIGEMEEMTLLNDIMHDETQDIARITVVGKLGDRLLLNADRQLWSLRKGVLKKDITDGASLQLYSYYRQEASPSFLPFFRKIGERYLFVARKNTQTTLLSSDGTRAGTKILTTFSEDSFDFLAQKNTFIYFANPKTGTIWKTDGTENGTKEIAVFTDWQKQSLSITKLLCGENGIYLTTEKLSSYEEGLHTISTLWKVDASTLNPKKIAEYSSEKFSVTIAKSYFHNGLLFFSVDDIKTRELYVSDGTSEHTVKVGSITDNFPDDIKNLTAAKSYMVFTGDDGVHGSELWKLTVSYK